MKWSDTTASTCRYGDVAGRIFADAEIIWQDSVRDYQGHANILAKMPDGRFCHYEWAYGSCSVCDDWQRRGLTKGQIEAEMREAAAWLADAATLRRYLRLEGEFADARWPTLGWRGETRIADWGKSIYDDDPDPFRDMREAFVAWEGEQEGPQEGQD